LSPRLLERTMDLQYRFYDRVRHRDAAVAAEGPGRTGPFEEVGDSGYLLLVTFKRDGVPVPTPVMFSRREGRVFVRTETRAAKVGRVRRDRHVRIARSNARGKPLSPVYEGRARELPPEEEGRAHDALFDGYSAGIRLFEGTTDRLPVQMTYLEITPVEAGA
jgi:uncharacterized protein